MPNCSVDSITVTFHQSPYGNRKIASVVGVDVRESCDGYNSEELRAISEKLQSAANDLDKMNSHSDTPILFDCV